MKYMGLKLGPALKLCHHIERLKQGKQWNTHTHTPSPPDVHLQPERTLRNISAALWDQPSVNRSIRSVLTSCDQSASQDDYLAPRNRFCVWCWLCIALPLCDVILVHRCFWHHFQPPKISFVYFTGVKQNTCYTILRGNVRPIIIIYSPKPYDFVSSVKRKKRRFEECSRCSFSRDYASLFLNPLNCFFYGWRLNLSVYLQ